MPILPDVLPFRAVKGFFGGMEDGFRGKIDSNVKYSDGKWENDPEKKSKAGRFTSEWLGVRGSAEKFDKIGKWGGMLAAGAVSASFFSAYVPAAIAAGAIAGGIFPIAAAVAMTVGAMWLGANVGAVVLRNAVKIPGAIAGAAVGAVTGLYNAVFKRGHYAYLNEAQPGAPEELASTTPPVEEVTPEMQAAAQQRAAEQAAAVPGQEGIQQNQASSVGLPGQTPLQQPQAGMTHSHDVQQDGNAVGGAEQAPSQGKGRSGVGKAVGIGAAALGGLALYNRFLGGGRASSLVSNFVSPSGKGSPSEAEATDVSEDVAITPPTGMSAAQVAERQQSPHETERVAQEGYDEAQAIAPPTSLPDPVKEFEEPMAEEALARARAQVDREGGAEGLSASGSQEVSVGDVGQLSVPDLSDVGVPAPERSAGPAPSAGRR